MCNNSDCNKSCIINALVNVINSDASDVTVDLADDLLFSLLNNIDMPKIEEEEEDEDEEEEDE